MGENIVNKCEDSNVKQLEHQLDKCKHGYFEIYKPDLNQEKRIASYQCNLEFKHAKNMYAFFNVSDICFGVFLCLMMRYTQSEMLTGVRVGIDGNRTSLTTSTVLGNSDLTFEKLMKSVVEEKVELEFDKRWIYDVLCRTIIATGCPFLCADSFDNCIDSLADFCGDICFQVVILDEKISLHITYNENVYDKAFIIRMTQHYNRLFMCLVNYPKKSIFQINYLSEVEEKLLTDDWNRTEHPYPEGYCIHQLFEQKVDESPDAVAVYYENKFMTRGELNKYANQLAYNLIELGVTVGDVVALYANKSINFVIGIMGILKAGAAYLPIDASYPQSRIEHLIEDSKTSIIVTTTDLNINTTLLNDRMIVKIDLESDIFEEGIDDNPDVEITPQASCYLIYTSGSTGKPKGVLLNHEGRVNNFNDFNSRFSITDKDKVLAVSSIGFDMSAYDILGTLIAGSSVVLPDLLLEKQPFHWMDLIEKYNVTIWHSVPVLLEILCKCCCHRGKKLNSIRVVLLGGDWIPVSLPDKFREINQQAVLISLGGATEVSMDSIIYYIQNVHPKWKSIPYGKPMWNQKAYILDQNRQLMPIGIPGELYLGGVGVADGYFQNDEDTKERFFDNPWFKGGNEYIYKTGDLAFFKPDGTIVLLGRIDFQVKINGTRIELGEIEQCLLKHKKTNRSVAIAVKVGTNKKIVAFVEYKSEFQKPNESEMMEYLTHYLPQSYIPAHIIVMKEIPISPNGKIDRKKLEEFAERCFV